MIGWNWENKTICFAVDPKIWLFVKCHCARGEGDWTSDK